MNTRPIVLGVHPVAGWRSADDARRAFAVLCPVLVAVWALVSWATSGPGYPLISHTALTLGPPAFYSAARVLRPHVGPDREREARHACASATTAFGTAILLGMAFNGGAGIDLLLVFPASLGLPVTVLWGLAALLVRACAAPVGQPRTWPSPVTT